MLLSKKLIQWYLQNKRSMPWRETKEPYHIWLSEIILQQTRVAQGLPYYNAFIKAFPTVFDLANASEEKVLKLWQGLGYYSRARNLHASAKYVANELNGVFPTSYKELLKLKGVGDYTASAIASICYQEPVAVVDGNVYRVLSRIHNIDTPINSTEGVKVFKQLATEALNKEQPADHNQAIMEFGAMHCKPQNPNCTTCTLQEDCGAWRKGTVPVLPVKLKKVKIKKRYFNFLVFLVDNELTVIEQRKGKGIWEGLYQFPLIETTKGISSEELVTNEYFLNYVKTSPYELTLFNDEYVVHKLSHQHLYTKFYVIHVKGGVQESNDIGFVKVSGVKQYPVPILIGNFIETFFKG